MKQFEPAEQSPQAPAQAANNEPIRRFTVDIVAADGCKLRTAVFLPAGAGPYATILMRTPYGITEAASAAEVVGQAGAAQGYATVAQDVRGRHGSDGDFNLGQHDQEDATATLDWITGQPWSDGAVVLRGDSAGGLFAWLAATTKHPAVRGVVVGVTGGVFDGFGYFDRGVVQPENLIGWVGNLMLPDRLARTGLAVGDPRWRVLAEGDTTPTLVELLTLGAGEEAHAAELMRRMTALTEANRRSIMQLASEPAQTHQQLEELMPWVAQWLAHPDPEDSFWDYLDYGDELEVLPVPGLHLGGWHDVFIRGTIRNYVRAASAALAPQRLIISPYTHYGSNAPVGSWTPPLAQQPDSMGMLGTTPGPSPDVVRNWLARYLDASGSSEIESGAPISLYVQRADLWRDEWEWPLARTEWTPLYLKSNGSANTADGDGALSALLPQSGCVDNYTYDPDDPVPSVGGTHLGAYLPAGIFDQTAVEARADVLVYTSTPFEEGFEITGPVTVTLFVSTSAVDTDFTARLTDVDIEGRSTNVCDGVVRLRFRAGSKGLVQPHSQQRVVVELSPTSYWFAPGHRVRLQVSSSNFPLQQPNSNTGQNEWLHDVRPQAANQTVFHGGATPSALLLPVVPTAD
ncbi:hypothetical protein A2J03_04310 [Rhodococcus sp. EPR-157]|uniref:CocE/NonD family hydrolase n=1 Tax=Rhodococcus sp. EPR-157 TaxID=1813677 RepID=UPI0007BC13B7|nr:CocE/NonD family hydrolase [Rhodococcus sp. EPR-157]KZF08527.1 hypothetical protein A2J03_04310 [Rhodococcus sp. EPR-157]